MNLIFLIPSILSLLSSVLGGGFSSSHRSGILATIFSGGWDGSLAGIMDIIRGTVNTISESQLAEIHAKMETLLAQAELNQLDQKSESFLNRGWRPTLAWGLSIITLIHLTIAEACNILFMFGITAVNHIAPMDNITVIMLTSLLGIYMGARTVEKVNSNTDN